MSPVSGVLSLTATTYCPSDRVGVMEEPKISSTGSHSAATRIAAAAAVTRANTVLFSVRL